MESADETKLLREYAAGHSEAAFETLVARRVRFVYSAALRQVGDPGLAEEVTQAVFIILARKAGNIRNGDMLTGWLFKTTRYAALAQKRAAARRRQHEKEAQMESELQATGPDPLWEQLSPLLDEGLEQLGTEERRAILLRFFEDKSLAEVGDSLGTGEDTARKRVSRALEKLRRFFLKRGVASTAALIAAALSANSVQAAPIGLANTITATVLKGSAVGVSIMTLVKGTIKIMTWIKAKTVIAIGAGTVLAGATILTLHQQEQQVRSQEHQIRIEEQQLRTRAQQADLSPEDRRQIEDRLAQLRDGQGQLRSTMNQLREKQDQLREKEAGSRAQNSGDGQQKP